MNDGTVKYLKVSEMAEILNVSTQSIRNAIKDGSLKSHRIGNSFRTSSEEFEEYIKNTSTCCICH